MAPRTPDAPPAPPALDLVSLSEVAKILGVASTSHAAYYIRQPGFPAPVAQLRAGGLWHRVEVEAWFLTWASSAPPGRVAERQRRRVAAGLEKPEGATS